MPAYLDHASGTTMRASAAAALVEALAAPGNPSSVHRHGQAARAVLEEARERLAAAAGCEPVEVLFTSGGTEAVNLAVQGGWRARAAAGQDVLLLPGGEHAATTGAARAVEAAGGRVLDLPVDGDGRLDPAVVADAAEGGDRALLTVLAANNEVGTVNDVPALVAAAGGVPVHVDAIAAFGAVPVDFAGSGASLMSLSSVKVGGPAGVGALLARRDAPLAPLLHGGGQERGLRSGTPAAPLALAFAVAAEQAVADLEAEVRRLAGLRDRALAGLLSVLPRAVLRGAPAGAGRLPGNLHVTVPGIEGESVLLLLDAAGVSVSTGSACLAGVTRLSPVLQAMGVPDAEAAGAVRITLGHSSTEADVDALLAALPAVARVAAGTRTGGGAALAAALP